MANSITTATARAKFAQAHGTSGTIHKVVKMAFGDGGVDGSNQPIPPVTGATALGNERLRKTLDSVSYPVPTTVRFIGSLAEEELVGVDISEIALVDENDDIVAIKTFTKKGKDGESEFVYQWDEEF
ncbi:MAG TPA: phage tail protein [Selenomonadales bacterium]|nr:phage tail protein [Selenomonadales bacterium]